MLPGLVRMMWLPFWRALVQPCRSKIRTSSCPDKTGRLELMQFGVRFREFQLQGAFLGLNEQRGRLAWLRVGWR